MESQIAECGVTDAEKVAEWRKHRWLLLIIPKHLDNDFAIAAILARPNEPRQTTLTSLDQGTVVPPSSPLQSKSSSVSIVHGLVGRILTTSDEIGAMLGPSSCRQY